MTIPKYNELFSNVLSLFSDEEEEYPVKYVKKIVADLLNLSIEERNEFTSSGREPIIENRVGWAITYLKKAGLLESKNRGHVNITKLGLKEISENPNITKDDLFKFPSFVEFIEKSGNSSKKEKNEYDNFKELFNNLNSQVYADLLNQISKKDIEFLKKLISKLLIKMEFFNFEVEVNLEDDRFQGSFNKDCFGLSKIGIQLIKTSDEINIFEIQQFAGFLVSNGLTKGIFITTSSFNSNVIEYINNQANLNIVLIDCNKLAELLIKYNIGIKTIETFELKAVDEDYFKEV